MSQETRLYSRWESGRRYYELRVQPDLWGDWCVIRVWGEEGVRSSRPVTLAMGSYAQAVEEYRHQVLLRRQRGYHLVSETEIL